MLEDMLLLVVERCRNFGRLVVWGDDNEMLDRDLDSVFPTAVEAIEDVASGSDPVMSSLGANDEVSSRIDVSVVGRLLESGGARFAPRVGEVVVIIIMSEGSCFGGSVCNLTP